MQAIVLADGDVGTRDALERIWPGWARPDAVVVAADGGARHAAALGVSVHHWVGDGDSIGDEGLARLAAAGVPIQRARSDKDESDTELAVLAACRLGATEIVIVGGFGGRRLDHTLANIGLLAMDALAGVDVRLVGTEARVALLRAADPSPEGHPIVSMVLDGRPGDLVTLLPSGGDAVGVTTVGLAYPLHDETLVDGRTRGLSNVRTGRTATVSLRMGRLVIVETPATL
jgi:thiamine pyrophosphokinase